MNAPDESDQRLVELYGVCLECGAPRRPSLSPESGTGWPLVCDASPDHDADADDGLGL